MRMYKVNSQNNASRMASWKIPITVFVLILFIIPLFVLGYFVADGNLKEYSLTVAILLAGGALGWVIGIFISPFPTEGEQFQSYAKAVAAGVSGYALAKIDPVISEFLKSSAAFQPQNVFRFLGFLIAFIIAMLGVFGWRRYT